MIERIKVYDMDGTLVDSLHRYRTKLVDGVEKIDLEYWRENCTPEKIMADGFLPLYADYREALNDPATYVIIATAREMTEADWQFVERMGAPDHFIFRKTGDTRRGADMKRAGLRKLFSLRQFSKVMHRVFFEDNRDYLAICDDLGMVPVLVESKQGH